MRGTTPRTAEPAPALPPAPALASTATAVPALAALPQAPTATPAGPSTSRAAVGRWHGRPAGVKGVTV